MPKRVPWPPKKAKHVKRCRKAVRREIRALINRVGKAPHGAASASAMFVRARCRACGVCEHVP